MIETRFIIIFLVSLAVLYLLLGDCKSCRVSEGFSSCDCGRCKECVKRQPFQGCVRQPVSTVAPPPLPCGCGGCGGFDGSSDVCACKNRGKTCGMCNKKGTFKVHTKPNYYGFGPWNWKYHYGEPYYIKFVNY